MGHATRYSEAVARYRKAVGYQEIDWAPGTATMSPPDMDTIVR
jgi:hypothetical protein